LVKRSNLHSTRTDSRICSMGETMSKIVLRIGRSFVLLVFVTSLFSYQGPLLATSSRVAVAAALQHPNGVDISGLSSIAFAWAAPGGLINNSHVQVAYSPALNPNGGALTIEAWVKRNSTSTCEAIVGNNFTVSYWLGFCTPTGHIRFYGHGANSP